MSPTSLLKPIPALAFALSLSFGCDGGCNGDDEESAALEQRGSVANAEQLTMRPVTEDGYEVVEASPRMRQQQEQARRSQARENLVLEPTEPDPMPEGITLTQAVEGMEVDGQLVAEIVTSLGTVFCDLMAEEAPKTVANFVGLARGKRPWWDARAGQWRQNKPYYDGTLFHRVLPDYLIQGGDYLADGTGRPGYTIAHEDHDQNSHDRAGLLAMASHGPDENGAQFFITDGPARDLDVADQYTVFGKCRNDEVVRRIARVPQGEENRPLTDVRIEQVIIQRVRGGAENARRTPPQLPEGYDPDQVRGASPGPSEQAIPGRIRDEDSPLHPRSQMH